MTDPELRDEDWYETVRADAVRRVARQERRRQFWFGFWTAVGLLTLVGLTALLTTGLTLGSKGIPYSTAGWLLIVGWLVGILALYGRDSNRKD